MFVRRALLSVRHLQLAFLCAVLLWFAFSAQASAEPSLHAAECVVLLHGHGRTGLSMKPVEWALERAGYRVVNVTYPSWRVPLERLADEHLHRALTERVPADATRIHFVTHSMGGILVRQYLATHELENLGRVVMLGPPNQGSELADKFKSNALMRCLGGRNLPRLGTAADDLPQRLGAVDFECGVIAGDRPACGWPRLKAGPSDGKVAVASTPVAGMRDFTTVHASHTFMMWRGATLRQVAEFLEHGKFVDASRTGAHASSP